MTNQELLQVLITFYRNPGHVTIYAGRWDVWCIQNNNWDTYKLLLLKTDTQLEQLLTTARDIAYEIEDSPLARALK